MTAKMLYHDPKSRSDDSPFDKAIRSIALEGELRLACPYISLDYLYGVISGTSWRLLTDIKELLRTQSPTEREKVVEFLSDHRASVRHYSRLHAKVAIGLRAVLFGSANFTNSGIWKRTEVSAIIDDAPQIVELTQWFEACWSSPEAREMPSKDAMAEYVKSLPVEPTPAEEDEPKLFPPLLTKPACLTEMEDRQAAAGETAEQPLAHENELPPESDGEDVLFHFPPASFAVPKKKKAELDPRECVERLIIIGLRPDVGEHLAEISQLVAIHRQGTERTSVTADSPEAGALIYQARQLAKGTGNIAEFVREAEGQRHRVEDSDYFDAQRAQAARIPLAERLADRGLAKTSNKMRKP